jgi:hypothetical protein
LKSQSLAVFLATISWTSVLAAQQHRPHPHWSVDLDKYVNSTSLYSDDVIAATDSYVAVAIDAKKTGTDSPKIAANSHSDLSVLVFEVNTGKLSVKCGPWTINGWFQLWPTAGGNFLLHLTSLSDTNPQVVETLLLLSPACAQLKQITLQTGGDAKKHPWKILQSPSRQTLLLIKEQEEGSGYEVRDLDTLELKKHWFEADSKTPIITGVSDKGFLGILPKPSSPFDTRPIADYFRTFEGDWRLLPESNYYSFLSDDALVGTENSFPEGWKVSGTQVSVVGLDGATIFSERVSGTGYHVGRSSDIAVSTDGNHFAFTLEFSGAGWLWGNLDMGPEYHSVYVWSKTRASLCARIKLENWLDHPSLALSFAPDGSWFAVLLNRSSLSIRSLATP